MKARFLSTGSGRWPPAVVMLTMWLLLLVKVVLVPDVGLSESGSSSSALQLHLPRDDLCASRAAATTGAPPQPIDAGAPSPRAHISSAFTGIYDTHAWGTDGEGSGSGSTLGYTASTRRLLEALVYRYNVTRFLDAPCGSAHWWPPLLAQIRRHVPCFEYRGLDVVASVVEGNAAKFASDPLTSFARADLSTADLPHGCDMSLTRDALQHLPLLDAIDVIAGISRAAPRVALFGSYTVARTPNRDIAAGDYYEIDLLKPPFDMTGVREVLHERSEDYSLGGWLHDGAVKSLLLFDGSYLAGLDFDAMRERARAAPFNARVNPSTSGRRALRSVVAAAP